MNFNWIFALLITSVGNIILPREQEEEPFVCEGEGCMKVCKTLTGIEKHYRAKHWNVGWAFCKYGCGHSYILTKKVHDHQKRCKKNPKNKKIYRCLCDKKFKDYDRLKRHVEAQIFLYICCECNKEFNMATNYCCHHKSAHPNTPIPAHPKRQEVLSSTTPTQTPLDGWFVHIPGTTTKKHNLSNNKQDRCSNRQNTGWFNSTTHLELYGPAYITN